MRYPVRLSLLAIFLYSTPLHAQETTESKAVLDNATLMREALTLRSAMALAISSEAEEAETALERLRGAQYPSGLRIGSDADFGYAALDVGQRLIVLNKMSEAAMFLEAAETALAQQVRETPDTQAGDKAQYLRNLALIRGNYLNKAAEAKEDIDAAIRLQPDDKHLKRFGSVLKSDKSDIVAAKEDEK